MKKFLMMGFVAVVVAVLFSQVASGLNQVFQCLSTVLGGGKC